MQTTKLKHKKFFCRIHFTGTDDEKIDRFKIFFIYYYFSNSYSLFHGE